MASVSAAKQSAKTLAAQIRGIFAGLDALPVWVDELDARDAEFAKREVETHELVKEEQRLRESLGSLTIELESQQNAGMKKMQEEFDKTHAALSAQIEPLRVALEEASERVTRAEAQAVEVETSCAARVEAAQTAASTAEARVARAEKTLSKLRALTGS